MNANFDPQAFIDLPIEEALTKRPPIPVGSYTAIVKSVTARPWQGKQDPTKSGMAYDLILTVEIPQAVREQLGLELETLDLRDGIMLDLNEGGGIDTGLGKNRQLRNYREALDMNKPGVTFRASQMVGQPLLVKVTHEIYQDAPVERISGVAKIGG